MRPLKPTTILVLAAGLTGLVVLPVFAALQPDMRSPYRLAVIFIIGATAGLIVVAPMAAAEVFRERFTRRFSAYAVANSYWYVSLSMMTAIGYIAASWHHQAYDMGTVAAFAVVYLGAVFKLFVGTVVECHTTHRRRRWWQMVLDHPINW